MAIVLPQFLPTEKTKLAGIAAGAEVNVNPDWNAVSGDAQILNKPTLGTAAATNSTDYATAAQGAKADTAVQPNLLGVGGADSITNMISLTQAEYNAIVSKNASTLYVIT